MGETEPELPEELPEEGEAPSVDGAGLSSGSVLVVATVAVVLVLIVASLDGGGDVAEAAVHETEEELEELDQELGGRFE